jgi:hypothetical protein
MLPTTVHFQDLTNEGGGVFSLSSCWGEHWSGSMFELRSDLLHEFGHDFKLIDMDLLSKDEYQELEVMYFSF